MSRDDFCWTVPGNLLLTGEYAVLNPGAVGLAVAAGPCLTVTTGTALKLELSGKMGSERFLPTESPLFSAVLEELPPFLSYMDKKKWTRSRLEQLPLSVSLDSTPFLRTDGFKAGFGSSAAAVAGLVSVLSAAALGRRLPAAALLPAAVRAHRCFQQGRGSGYDVAASLFGGVGLFCGGDSPEWTPLQPAWPERIWCVPGAAPVSSGRAAASYSGWSRAHPAANSCFCALSSRQTYRLAESGRERLVSVLNRAALPGRRLGSRLGRNPETGLLGTRLAQLRSFGWGAKASGAGDELGVAFPPLQLYFKEKKTAEAEFLRLFELEFGWRPFPVQIRSKGADCGN